ncbi:MAG: hypothetical protein HT580_09975 [Dechloromonas sp.]|nr:MAG: hypothetical protein HT580_09975 [Dechloromonas sp.]
MASNGAYTFTPHQANYSGPVPVITYTLASSTGETETATLTLNVTPVSDAPRWLAHSGVTTNEDTLVSLNLKMPAITDAVDQTGALADDHPERLGFITLESVDTGTLIYKADGTTLLFEGKLTATQCGS